MEKYLNGKEKVIVKTTINEKVLVSVIMVNNDGVEIEGETKLVCPTTLFDEPMKTTYEKKIADEEKKLNTILTRNQKEIDKSNSTKEFILEENRRIIEANRKKLQFLRNVFKEPILRQIDPTIQILTRLIELDGILFAVKDYNHEILELDFSSIWRTETPFYSNNQPDIELRLLSLYGRADGLFWRLSKYSDGSGSNDDYKIFTSKIEAINYIQNRIDCKKSYYDSDVKAINEHGLKFNNDVMIKFFEEAKERTTKEYNNCKNNLVNCEKRLNDINENINKVIN